MNRIVCAVLLITLCLPPALGVAGEPDAPEMREPMTQSRLARLVEDLAAEYEAVAGAGGEPAWINFVYDGVPMACISDATADRMRITSPIGTVSETSARNLLLALEANFHSALDARYATSDGVVHAVFVHPLSSLTPPELESAVRQVATAARTFGTAFTSGELVFPSQLEPAPTPDDDGI
jgi:hypothetical protein